MAFKLTPPSISQSLNLPISQSPNLPISPSQSLNLSISQSINPPIRPSRVASIRLPVFRCHSVDGIELSDAAASLPQVFHRSSVSIEADTAACGLPVDTNKSLNLQATLPLRRSLSLSHRTTHHPPPTTPPSCQPAPPSHDPRAPPAIATPTLRRSIT